MSHVLGIDLGTTTTVVSVYRENAPEVVPIDGRNTMPSVLYVGNDGEIEIGFNALKRMAVSPLNVINSSKRYMGKKNKKWKIAGKSFTPVDVASIILTKAREAASLYLGEDVRQAVITVPAYFNEAQRKDTVQAGTNAGFEVLRLVPEPTAAAISYGLDNALNETILVYDLGGGTFDVSVLKVADNEFSVLSVDGDSFLGGDDFTDSIVNHLKSEMETIPGIKDMFHDQEFNCKLWELAEQAKQELSEREWTDINVSLPNGETFESRLSRARYNTLIRHYLSRSIDKVKSALRAADIDLKRLDRVVLIGGSTRNVAVRQLVTEEIKEPYQAENVDLAVSFGAAIVGSRIISGKNSSNRFHMQNLTAHTLGIDMQDKFGNSYFQPLIPKNTALPARACVMGFARPFQCNVIIGVYRGESSLPTENTFLGELHLSIENKVNEPVPVVAVFELDEDGLLTFTSIELPACNDLNEELGAPLVKGREVDIDILKQLLNQGVVTGASVEIQND